LRLTFRKSKLMIGLGAGVVALLGTAGLTYTLWTQNITFTGNVSTGSMNVHYTSVVSSGKSIIDGATLGGNDNGTGSCTGEISKDGQTATLTITNGYPGFVCNLDFPYTNDGTVLAVATKTVVTGSGDFSILQWFAEAWCSVSPGQDLPLLARVSVPSGLTDHMGSSVTVSWIITYTNYFPGEVGVCGTYTPNASFTASS